VGGKHATPLTFDPLRVLNNGNSQKNSRQ